MKYCNRCGDIVENGEKFCNKCGNFLGGYQNNQNNNIYQKNSKNIIIYLGIGIGVVFILGALFLLNHNVAYYFDSNSNQQNNDTQSDSFESRKTSYSTAIIYDNTYSGVTITGTKDAYDLIVKDSIAQKDKCPKKITKTENEIIKKYGLTAVNLCEVDTGFAKEISNVFKKIYSEYPEARGYLTNLSLANVKITEGYIAAFMPVFIFATSNSDNQYPAIIKTQILLNSSYFLNKERLNNSVTSGSKTGHFPKNATMYSPVAHELGHYLSFLAMMKSYNMESILLIDNNKVYDLNQLIEDFSEGNHSLKMINEAYEKYKKDTKDNIEFDKWRATISGYAVAKKNNGQYIYDETIAESFHDVYLNGNKASTASKYIINVLKEKLKG